MTWAAFFRHGVEDADRRVAAALAPVRIDAADRYLKNSRFVTAIDRATLRLQDWWRASVAGRALRIIRDEVRRAPVPARYHSLACGLLIAVAAHVALVVLQGPRPGWVLDSDPGDGRGLCDAVIGRIPVVTVRGVSATPPIKVLALSPIPEEGAGCRFRVSQYIPYLRAAGFEVTVSPFYSREYFSFVYRPGNYLRKTSGFVSLTLRRLKELFSVRDYDLVLLYREAIPIGPPLIERRIAQLGIPIVYDFDDAIFLPAVSEANQAVSFLKNPEKVPEILKLSEQVSVGNEFLASYARRFNPHVTVIPTAVDTTRFVPRTDAAPADDRKLVVGWIGSPTTFQYLESLKDVLSAVSAKHPFTLKVSGAGRAVNFPGVDVQVAPWSMADEVTLFNTCDIGVYPLTDDDWSRGKCGFKAIQCMACGVPVVAAAVGVNREIISHGVNSMLASTPQDWIDHLSRLLTDAALRRSMAIAGRATIEARYSLKVTAPQLADVLRAALASQS